jgi:2-dehydropantoate 2-reductase
MPPDHRKIMTEIKAIAEKQNISLPADIVEVSIAKADNFRFETKTSFQRDVEQKYKRDEGGLFGGAVLRLGEEHHVPTPETRAVYERIQIRRDR